MLMGRANRAVGDEEAAQLEFDAARTVLADLGAVADLDRLERLAAESDRPAAAAAAGLTRREVEVLRLIAGGRSNRQIANDLFLSERTVARHVSNILGKLGLANRAGATAFAFEHGLNTSRWRPAVSAARATGHFCRRGRVAASVASPASTHRIDHPEVIMSTTVLDTAVVGAGAAGLLVGRRLADRGVRFELFDDHARIGDSWRERYRSLRLFTPRPYLEPVGPEDRHRSVRTPHRPADGRLPRTLRAALPAAGAHLDPRRVADAGSTTAGSGSRSTTATT